MELMVSEAQVRAPDFVECENPKCDCHEAVRRVKEKDKMPSVDGNPKAAFGALKAPLHLVPPALALTAADGMAEGAAKYGAYNWREPGKGIKASTYHGAILRHLYAMMDGEDVDPDSPSGKLHLAGLAANVAILCDAHHGGFLTDDRPPVGPAPRLVIKKGA